MKFLITLLSVFPIACAALAADPVPNWPQFRGAGALGIADAEKPPVEIGPMKNVKWKVAVPPGLSCPVIWGDKLFLTAFENDKLFTIAYSRTDGKELWRQEAPAAKIEVYMKTEGSPAASTVATDGQRVIAYFGSCGLLCYDFDGKLQWKYELPCAETNYDFGSGTSPILVDGMVILGRDLMKGSKLIVVDAKTGSLLWEKSREGFPTSYSSPAIWDQPTGKEIVFPGFLKLTAYDLKTGAQKWTVSGMPAVTCTTPVVVDGELIFAGWSPSGATDFKMPTFDELLKQGDEDGDGVLTEKESEKTFLKGFFKNNDTNHDGKLTREEWDAGIKAMAAGKNCAVAIKLGGTGDISATHVRWKVTKGMPYVPTPLVYRGQMYTISNRGQLSAYDVKTGKEVFTEENIGLTGAYASPVAANGYVYLFGLDGTAVVLKAGDFADVKHRVKFPERIAATPAIVDNTLYVRGAKTLYAFSEK